MNPEIIKTTLVVEKKYTYPNGLQALYSLKDNELYSYSLSKDGHHFHHRLSNDNKVKELTYYKALSYFEGCRLSFEKEEDILNFNDFNSLYCIPENVIRTLDGKYLNFPIEFKGIHYYPSTFRRTKKAVELFAQYLHECPEITLAVNLVVEPIPYYNQDTNASFSSHHISSGVFKFSDEFFTKNIVQKNYTFYMNVSTLLYKLEEIFVEKYKHQLEEVHKQEFEDLI